MTQPLVDAATVPGWGVDADPQNDPTFPMRDRARDDESRTWVRPPPQESPVEVLQSNEHVRRPAVFGTAAPPRGLSGVLRRNAFAFSESQWAHWLLLMGADRVDMVEGVIEDLARGKVPNLYREMGLGAQMKHNREAFLQRTNMAVAVGTIALGVLMVHGNRRRARRRMR